MPDTIEKRFRRVAPDVDFCSLRFMDERQEALQVRQGVLQPVSTSVDRGVMITIIDQGGLGYAATSDLTESGLKQAVREARRWARKTAAKAVTDFSQLELPESRGTYESPVEIDWKSVPVADKVDWLRRENERLKTDDRIVDWEASLWYTELESLFLTADGGRIEQRFRYLAPSLSATANEGAETQTRTHGGRGHCQQGGLEVLDRIGYWEAAPRIAGEALELLGAPNCPSGKMDVLFAPDQMILQIHESIGHPLELDRILGDERNYAGTSFVTLDMFGTYRYGSKLLNITYDPTMTHQFASFGFDDEGLKAKKQFIIRKGILERPLGGMVSQQRAGLKGVANSRASSWNRPPIDRMANLNLEPGASTFEEMVASIDHGIYMQTNCSWSIDDSRNKFQFGCERGQLIENGKLAGVVKKPNYRGISATFWRNLKMVGNAATRAVMGTPHCGKGEPNQVVRVGHASPACVFADVDVFGGA
ncbi:MAG: TldD/PmbA family protein [Candidatus Eiseniibacteriota bacterium]|jgi:predicted Zn-dependent protease